MNKLLPLKFQVGHYLREPSRCSMNSSKYFAFASATLMRSTHGVPGHRYVATGGVDTQVSLYISALNFML